MTGTGEVRIAAGGEFGVAVAGHVRDLLPDRAVKVTAVGVTAEPVDPAAFVVAGCGFAVRADWRDVRAEFAAFAAAALAARVPWLPVAYGHPYIRVGPAVVPGLAPCHACYLTRLRQHDPVPDEAVAGLEGALLANPRLGLRGFAPHHAMLAAGLTVSLLDGAEAGRTGHIATIDCRTDEVARWRVVPADGCADCGEGARP